MEKIKLYESYGSKDYYYRRFGEYYRHEKGGSQKLTPH